MCWPAETALVSLVSEGFGLWVEESEPGAAGSADGATDSPLSLGCGFKGVSRKASSKRRQGRCFLEEGRGSREHDVYQDGASWRLLSSRCLCAGSRDDRVDGSGLQCKPGMAPISWLSLPLGTHTAVSWGWDAHVFLPGFQGDSSRVPSCVVRELLKTESGWPGINMDFACKADFFFFTPDYIYVNI